MSVETPYTLLQRKLSIQTMKMIQIRKKSEYELLIKTFEDLIEKIDSDMIILDFELNCINEELRREDDI